MDAVGSVLKLNATRYGALACATSATFLAAAVAAALGSINGLRPILLCVILILTFFWLLRFLQLQRTLLNSRYILDRGAVDQVRKTQFNRSIMKVDAVIASCASDLSWAEEALAHLNVIVLEKCGPGSLSDGGKAPRHASKGRFRTKHHGATHTRVAAAAASMASDARSGDPGAGVRRSGGAAGAAASRFQYVTVNPNRGRDGMAITWYLAHRYHSLADYTIFLQGDAPNHVKVDAVVKDALNQVRTGPVSFLGLAGSLKGALHAASPYRDLGLYCDLFHNFTYSNQSTPCYVWVAPPWNTFMVSRSTVHRHKQAAYQNLLSFFDNETASDHAWGKPRTGHKSLSHYEGTVFMERSWALIFGCTRSAGPQCTFSADTPRHELKERCPYGEGTPGGRRVHQDHLSGDITEPRLGCRAFGDVSTQRSVNDSLLRSFWAKGMREHRAVVAAERRVQGVHDLLNSHLMDGAAIGGVSLLLVWALPMLTMRLQSMLHLQRSGSG